MKANSQFLAAWTPQAQALLRMATAYLFLLHGSAKLLDMPHLEGMGSPEAFSLFWWSGALELVGGALLLVGLLTRPTAFIVSGEMAFAYFMGHASQGSPLLPILNQGDSAVLFCFIFLFLTFAGPGAWSVDGAIASRRRA